MKEGLLSSTGSKEGGSLCPEIAASYYRCQIYK